MSDIKTARAEKLTWIKAVVENVHRDEVLAYDRKKNGDTRLHLFIPEHSYIVILTESKRAYYFVTAYHIDYSYKRLEYEKEYRRYGPKTKTAP
jgi:hypothetical protein